MLKAFIPIPSVDGVEMEYDTTNGRKEKRRNPEMKYNRTIVPLTKSREFKCTSITLFDYNLVTALLNTCFLIHA